MRYSEYQLLVAHQLRSIAAAFKGSRSERGIDWDLPAPPSDVARVMGESRFLAMALELVAPRYRPRIMRSVRSRSEELFRFIDEVRPDATWSALTVDPERLLRQAEHLLANAHSFDPLGKWSRVVRIGSPARWKDLRFEALVAMDYRLAAEHCLGLREDVAAAHMAPELDPVSTKWWGPRHERLAVDVRERAQATLDFQLIDTPSVVVALEGATEMEIAPRVLALMGMEAGQGRIQLVSLKGVDGDVRLLARAVAVPRLDPDGHFGARILQSLTALVVVVDPEKGYATDAACERKRQGIVDEIYTSVPEIVRTPTLRGDLEHLVTVRTWGAGGPFEFAHFSDAEIAGGIRRVVGPSAPKQRDLAATIAKHRHGDRRIDAVWRKWPVKPTKPELARALWPTLERRILSGGRRRVPLADVLHDAAQLAYDVSVVRELRTKVADQAEDAGLGDVR